MAVLCTVTTLVALFASFSVVQAQTSNVTCPAKYNFLLNSKSQTPCVIAAYLEEACVTDGSNWNVPALSTGLSYIGPHADQATYCSCSSVVYSLISACAACQSHEWISWSNWIVNCTQQTTTLGTYPLDIPSGTEVPAYAYLDVSVRDTFNLTQAQADKDPESTYFGTPTASINYHLTSASASVTLTGITNPSNTAAAVGATGGKSKTNVGAIVGGVIGGLVVLALIGILVFLLLRRNKKNAGGGPPSPVAYYNGEEHPMTHPNGIDYGAAYPASPTLYSDSQPTTNQKLYDPSDPSTFPQTPASFAYGSTAGDGSLSGAMSHGQTMTSGKYTGAAEI